MKNKVSISAILGGLGGLITAIALLLNALQPYVLEKPMASSIPEGYVEVVRDTSLIVKSNREFTTPARR